jgi:hypothetical protein
LNPLTATDRKDAKKPGFRICADVHRTKMQEAWNRYTDPFAGKAQPKSLQDAITVLTPAATTYQNYLSGKNIAHEIETMLIANKIVGPKVAMEPKVAIQEPIDQLANQLGQIALPPI